MNGPINEDVSSALTRVFSRRSAILKIVEEKALGTRLPLVATVENLTFMLAQHLTAVKDVIFS